jgi:hypothetical protein
MSFRDFKVLTFDVVGTLIDFESGILRAVRRISGKTPAELSDDRIFESYKRGRDAHYERSSEVMGLVYLHLAKELGIPADSGAAEAFQMEVLRWPAFPGSGRRAERLRARFRLVAMTNADRSAFSFYSHALGNPFHDSSPPTKRGAPSPTRSSSPSIAGGSRVGRLQDGGNPTCRAKPVPRHRHRQVARIQDLLDRATPGTEGLWRHAGRRRVDPARLPLFDAEGAR